MAKTLAGFLMALSVGVEHGDSEGKFTDQATQLAQQAGLNITHQSRAAETSWRAAKCGVCGGRCRILCRELPEILYRAENGDRRNAA
jgi:hypothetical protein